MQRFKGFFKRSRAASAVGEGKAENDEIVLEDELDDEVASAPALPKTEEGEPSVLGKRKKQDEVGLLPVRGGGGGGGDVPCCWSSSRTCSLTSSRSGRLTAHTHSLFACIGCRCVLGSPHRRMTAQQSGEYHPLRHGLRATHL
jgi:hypothetical protein